MIQDEWIQTSSYKSHVLGCQRTIPLRHQLEEPAAVL